MLGNNKRDTVMIPNPGSDCPEISLIRTKSAGTDFCVRTNWRFSNPQKLVNPEISARNKRDRVNESSLYPFTVVSDKKCNQIVYI